MLRYSFNYRGLIIACFISCCLPVCIAAVLQDVLNTVGLEVPDLSIPDTALCKLEATDVELSEGFGSIVPTAPSKGTLKTYMIFVDFPDAPSIESTESLYDVLMPEASNWYTAASFGQLTLQVSADMYHFYRMPQNSTLYNFQRGMSYEEHARYIEDALDSVGTNVNFSGIDVLYVVPTSSAKNITYSPTCMGPVTAADTNKTQINKTVTFGQDMHSWGSKVLNHETGHTMGLPDLYPFSSGAADDYVGGFDLMADIHGVSPNYFAWHKWKLGWFADTQFDCVYGVGSTLHVLTPIELSNGTKGVIIRHNASTAIVAESRTSMGLDEEACGEGVLIYSVSTNTSSGWGPIRVQDSTPTSGGCKRSELNDAPFTVGEDFVSGDLGIHIAVVSRSGDDYTVRVEVW